MILKIPCLFGDFIRMRSAPASLVRSLLSGATIALAGDFFARGLSLFIALYIARKLGPTMFGEYTTAFASFALVSSVMGFGLDTWLLREVGREPSRLFDLVVSVLIVKLFAASVVIALLYLTDVSTRTSLGLAFFVGCAGTVADGLIGTAFAALRARRHNASVAVIQLFIPAILLAAILSMQYLNIQIQPASLIVAQCGISWALVVMIFGLGTIRLSGKQIQPNTVGAVFGAWAFVVADLLANVYGQSATLFLRNFIDTEAVGIFKPALNVLSMTYIPSIVVFGVSLPMLSAATSTPSEYDRALKMLILGGVIYGIAAALTLWAGAPRIVDALYGVEYANSIFPLKILSVASIFKIGSFICALVMLSLGRQNLRILLQGIAVIINLVLGFIVIRAQGISGAAWVTTITEIALFSLYFFGAIRSWQHSRTGLTTT
jgi:O-antigen/teichoic acid export membrane protein